MIENIIYNTKLIAIIIRSNYQREGINFFTPENFSQQLAYMNYPKGKIIRAHKHRVVAREVFYTQEVLIIKRGRLKADFYNEHNQYLESRILEAGDAIFLASGGHGFEVLDEIEMIEVKQGPYSGERDKISFDGIDKKN